MGATFITMSNQTPQEPLPPKNYPTQSDLSKHATEEEISPSTYVDGIRLNTCTNLRSIIAIGQYHAYYTNFGLPNTMRSIRGKEVRIIGGIPEDIG